MKKLNINSIGRMPFLQKDIEFMTSDIHSLLEDMIHELGTKAKYFIICGCKITVTGDAMSMTPGWAYYDGEILPVRGLDKVDVSSIFGTKYVKLVKITYHDPAGTRRFKKADETAVEVADVWQDDYLNSVPSGAPAVVDGFYIKQDPWTLSDRIRKGINDDSGWMASGNVNYRKCGNIVFLDGEYFDDSLSGYDKQNIATLPSPSKETIFPAIGNGATEIRIDSHGNLLLSGVPGAKYCFNHIVYLSDSKYIDTNDHTVSMADQNAGGVEW